MKKNIILSAFVVVIIGAIWYLQGLKAGPIPVNVMTDDSVAMDTSMMSDSADASSSDTMSPEQKTSMSALQAIASADVKAGYKRAPALTNPTGFINTEKFALSDLVGKKVVLLDFWTYSCINCIRTIPYLNAWYEKYHDAGLEIVGVHTPEFEFEKQYDNVKAAVEKFGIKYPVVLDSNYGTWTAYSNLYWPHEYLIDLAGYIVHDHIGEGGYAETEAEIQKLLAERAKALDTSMNALATSSVVIPSENVSIGQSPETYFGAARNSYLGNGERGTVGVQTLTTPASFSLNTLYLDGTWDFEKEYAMNESAKAKIFFKYRSAKVFLVGDALEGVAITVLRDGKPIDASVAGSDVVNGKVNVKESRLYNIVNDKAGSGEHTLELLIENSGLHAYTFTFG